MKPYVVGIAGGSASGKTTFANALAHALQGLKVHVIHMDTYFQPERQRPQSRAPITGKTYLDDNHPLTLDLPKLADDLAGEIAKEEHRVILVEGHFALHDPAIYGQMDLKLFIDCRADERIVRRLRRNMARGLPFDQISEIYLDLVRYRHDEYVEPSKWRADLILNGSHPSETALELITCHIKGRLA